MSTTTTATAVAVGGEEPGDRTPSRTPASHVASAVTTPTNTTRASSRQPTNPAPARAARPRRHGGPPQGPGPPAEAPQRLQPRHSCELPAATRRLAPAARRQARSVTRRAPRARSRRRGPSGRSFGGRRRGLELAAQVPDVAVDRPLVRLEREPVDRVEQLRPRPDAAGLARERRQQLELGRRQRDLAARGGHAAAGEVEPQVAGDDPLVARGAASARRRTARTRATSSLGLNGLTT